MNRNCNICLNSLDTGDTIFQLARGNYIQGCLTPTYRGTDAVISEGHEICFSHMSTILQTEPYVCIRCMQPLDNGELVVYGVIGRLPAPGFTRPESRGYKMPYIVHEVCWIED